MHFVEDGSPRPENAVADNDISCRLGDYLLVPAASSREWLDPQPADAHDFDVAAVAHRSVWMLDDHDVVELPLRYQDAFQLQRAAFLIGGSAAMEAATRAEMAATAERLTSDAPSPRDPAPIDRQTEEFLVGVARGLLGIAQGQIMEFNAARLASLVPHIQKKLLERLAEAREEILGEARIYLAASPNSATVNLRLRRPELGAPPDMTSLAAALAPLQALNAQIGEIVSARFTVTSSAVGVSGSGMPMVNQELSEAISAEIAPMNAEIRLLRAELGEAIIRTGLEYPIAWKIWSRAPLAPSDRPELQQQIYEALKDALAANEKIAAQIRRKPGSVWDYGVAVEEALDLHQVPQFSCVRVAALERCGMESPGREMIRDMTLASGLASLGVVVAGAVVATPITIAVLIADAALNIVDAIAELDDYLRKSAAYSACLDPRKAIVAEPSLASAAFVIGLDLLSAIPGGGLK